MDRIAFKSIVISDVHLGSPHSKLVEVTKFLSMVNCERLIMAGDIIDGWQLKSEDSQWGYDRFITQKAKIASFFAQNEWKNDKWGFLVGGRLDWHNMLHKPPLRRSHSTSSHSRLFNFSSYK